MDVTATTPRLSVYFAVGVRWGEQSQAQSGSAGGTGDSSARAATAGPTRVIDVQARRVEPDAASRKAPGRRQGNIFLTQSPVTTYAPPAAAGQPVRLVQSAPTPGQKLDTWA